MKSRIKSLLASLIFLIGLLAPLVAQPTSENIVNLQQKYWYYRYRLLNDFLVAGGNTGHSVAATKRSGEGVNALTYPDATIHHGWYLGVLATEYKLLESNPFSTDEEIQQTLVELFFAMEAVNRLDAVAEALYGGAPDANGFFVRSDHPGSFLTQNSPVPGMTNGDLLNSSDIGIGPVVNSISSGATHIENPQPNDECYNTTFFNAEESQDQYINLTLGLAFIMRCLPDQNILLESLNMSYNFHDEASDMWNRMLSWIANAPPDQTSMTCQWDWYGNTVGDFHSNTALTAAAVGIMVGDIPSSIITIAGASELSRFIIHNPATEEIAHRGAFAWFFSNPMVKGYETMTGNSGPSAISWSGSSYDLYSGGPSDDTDAMSCILGTVCDCWGINSVNKLTLVGSLSSRDWQPFYVPALNFLHDKKLSNISDYTDDLYEQVSSAPCYGPAYFAVDQELAHRNSDTIHTAFHYNSHTTGWASHLRYIKDGDQQYRINGEGDETVGFLPGLDFMLAHNVYLLNVNENQANYNSFYKNRFSITSEQTFPLTYNYVVFPNVLSTTVGNSANPLEMMAFESISSRDIIEALGEAEYRAGNTIRFLPGTHMNKGAEVWAHIQSFDCAGEVTNNDNTGYDRPLSHAQLTGSTAPLIHERIENLTPVTHPEPGIIAEETTSESQVLFINERQNAEASTSLKVYPNPANGEDIKFSKPTLFRLYDMTGNLVLWGDGDRIERKDLEAGYYILHTESGTRIPIIVL